MTEGRPMVNAAVTHLLPDVRPYVEPPASSGQDRGGKA